MAFLSEVSGHKLESSQTQVFVWFSILIFCPTIIYSKKDLRFLVWRIFLQGFLKPEKNIVFQIPE